MQPSELQALIGQQVALSGWVPITQARVNAFADATGDHQFIHVDPEKAAQTPFGGPIAHGFLTLSLLAGEFANLGGSLSLDGAKMVVNYGLGRVRFIAPVRSAAACEAAPCCNRSRRVAVTCN